MKTVRWTVFIGGTLAGGSPNKKPATKSLGAERSEAQMPPLPWEMGYDLRKNLLIALCNRKRGIARALRVFAASRG